MYITLFLGLWCVSPLQNNVLADYVSSKFSSLLIWPQDYTYWTLSLEHPTSHHPNSIPALKSGYEVQGWLEVGNKQLERTRPEEQKQLGCKPVTELRHAGAVVRVGQAT